MQIILHKHTVIRTEEKNKSFQHYVKFMQIVHFNYWYSIGKWL